MGIAVAFGRRAVALLCLLALLLPALPLTKDAALQRVAAIAADLDGGARLAIDAGTANQPAMLGKLLAVDSGDGKRMAGGAKPALPPANVLDLSWGIGPAAAAPPAPEIAAVAIGIRRGDRSPTGPPPAA